MLIKPTRSPLIVPTRDSLVAPGGLPWDHPVQRVASGPVDLATQIAALYTAAGWVTPGIFLARSAADFSLVGSAVETWVNHGTGSDAVQATAAARPTYSATAINSLPGITLDGGDVLATGAINLTAYTAAALSVLFRDTDTAQRAVASFGPTASGNAGALELETNVSSAGTVEMRWNADGTNMAMSRSLASYPMTTPAVVTGTADSALSTDEVEIRHAGVNVTSARNQATQTNAIGNYALNVGGRASASLAMTGAIGAVVLAAGTTAVPTATVAAVEAILAAAWGL